MRIGIDLRKLHDTGIGRYVENLVRNLVAVEEGHRYVLFHAPAEPVISGLPEGRVEWVPEPAAKYSIREHFSLSSAARRHRLDLFHAPHYTLPLLLPCRSVVTIHDLIHLHDPAVGPLAKGYARFMIGGAVRKAGRIIAVSEAAGNDIAATFPDAAGKLRVVRNGGGDFSPMAPAERDRVLAGLGVAAGYFLFVGSDRPHKNLKAVPAILDRLDGDARFVVVGRVADKTPCAGHGGRIIFLERLDKEQMRAVYCGAAALCFPSYLEGFGLPPLEAMACGVPVVASNRSAVPEVVGEGGVLLDPDDHDHFAESLARIAADAGYRKELAAAGFRRRLLFDWRETARRTLAVYEEAMT